MRVVLHLLESPGKSNSSSDRFPLNQQEKVRNLNQMEVVLARFLNKGSTPQATNPNPQESLVAIKHTTRRGTKTHLRVAIAKRWLPWGGCQMSKGPRGGSHLATAFSNSKCVSAFGGFRTNGKLH